MSVGLPGSGIGGVFYLLSAICMPLHSAQRSVRGKRTRWALMLKQTTLAVLIIGALWGTGYAIDLVLSGAHTTGSLRAAIGSGAESSVPRVLRAATFGLTFGTLAFVLLMVQVLRLIVRPRPATTLMTPTEGKRKAA
jgi:hypothetical protein